MSSTGKSAYTDFAGEVVLAWAVDKAVTLRVSEKAHQCAYFPAVRNDWEYYGTAGASWKVSPRWQLGAELLDHRGWNVVPGISDRNFKRTVVAATATLKL